MDIFNKSHIMIVFIIVNTTISTVMAQPYHTGGEAFKRRLAHSVALTYRAYNNFLLLLRNFIANVLK